MKPRIRISFSGGRTSALMTKLLHEQFGESHDILTTFANTGCEHEATLEFVRRCDEAFGLRCVWLEAVTDPEEGKGITSQIMTFETASRSGEPFEAYIAKYGIPNMTTPNCTTRLKELPMDHYTHKVHGWEPLSYDTAIGIRADEADRMSAKMQAKRFIYPLVKAGITKEDVSRFWKSQPFDLQIPGDHFGNCTWCWKKSLRKLMTLAKEDTTVFDFPARMEREYGHVKAGTDYAATGPDGRRHFFRQHLDTTDIIRMAKEPFDKYSDRKVQPTLFDGVDWELDPLDIGGGCGDSCEVGADTYEIP